MTPGARVAAAIEILDEINEGLAAEQALTRWARGARFAGSKDRAAIRDHVFDVLRCKATAEHYGKGETGRALMIGHLRTQGADLATLFSGEGYGPTAIAPGELDIPTPPTDKAVDWNLPSWLLPEFERSLSECAEATALALQQRAPVFLRVNLRKTDRATAQEMLAAEGILTQVNLLADTALTVSEGARRIRNSDAYKDGFVELQDAASQAVVATLPPGGRVLDYCAGGGGKTLALAADKSRQVFAHDAEPRRMRDLPIRAERAGIDIKIIPTERLNDNGSFDLVLCDAPCSGSGAWRRAAEGKWTLSPEKLNDLNTIQDHILDSAAALIAPGGMLAYATCSVLRCENEDRIDAFLTRNKGWKAVVQQRFDVNDDGDGFFISHLKDDN